MASKSNTKASQLPAPAPKPGTGEQAVGDTIEITAISAANPAVCSYASADASKIAEGDTVSFASSLAELDGQTAIVSSVTGTSFSVPIDLSAVDTTAATATATVTDVAPAPGPSPSPPPSPNPDDVKDALVTAFTSYPCPGIGALPVAPNPNDTPPGTYVGMIVQPRNPQEALSVKEGGGVEGKPYVIQPGDAFTHPEAIPRADKGEYARSLMVSKAKERAEKFASVFLPQITPPGVVNAQVQGRDLHANDPTDTKTNVDAWQPDATPNAPRRNDDPAAQPDLSWPGSNQPQQASAASQQPGPEPTSDVAAMQAQINELAAKDEAASKK